MVAQQKPACKKNGKSESIVDANLFAGLCLAKSLLKLRRLWTTPPSKSTQVEL